MTDSPTRSALGLVALVFGVAAVGIPMVSAIVALVSYDPTSGFDFGPGFTALFTAFVSLPYAGLAGLLAFVLGTVDRKRHRPQHWFGGLAVGLGALMIFPCFVALIHFGFIA